MHGVISVTFSLWGVLSWFLFPRTLHSLIYGLCCVEVDDPEADHMWNPSTWEPQLDSG